MSGWKQETSMYKRSFRRVLVTTLLLATVMSGCTESATTAATSVNADSIQTLPVPAGILSSRAIDINQLEVEAIVNGERVQASRQGNSWQVSFLVSPGENISLTITWFENFEGTRLPLANWSDNLSFQENQNIAINPADYITDIFDNDGDGSSNLAERDAGTPPLPTTQVPDMDFDGVLDASDNCPAVANSDQADDDADSEGNVCDNTPRGPDPDGDGIAELDNDNCPAIANPDQADTDEDGTGDVCDSTDGTANDGTNSGEVDVGIVRIPPAQAPTVDGLYDPVWESAQFVDNSGNRLSIDNLMVDTGKDSSRSDGNTEFQWAAMHDGTNLYLFVFGETIATATLQNDSADDQLHADDSVELFFDGNNSKLSSYDTVDDTHVLIALLDRDGNPSGRIEAGFEINVDISPDVEFFNCLCSPVVTWEIKIPIAALNITIGEPFGIDIQINDDIDGGDRDSKWGWFHPPGSDTGFFNPSTFGTGVLR